MLSKQEEKYYFSDLYRSVRTALEQIGSYFAAIKVLHSVTFPDFTLIGGV
jgi:hypothetical protein